MAACPVCRKEFPPGLSVCPDDGAALQAVEQLGRGDTDLSGPTPTSPRPVGRASDPGAERLAHAKTDVSGGGTTATATGPGGAAAALAVAAPNQSMDPLVGARVAGRYEVIRRIGEGGMGAVYEARHTVIEKRVALKVLLEKFEAKSDFVARLLQEARLASSIGHINIVDVTDFGITEDGRSFVVMEFLDGESLAQLLARDAPLPVERCLRICRQVASALSAAHAKGIVHRDVKPENVYLVQRGEADFVKVVDFGISKAVQPADNDSEGQRLTHTGTLLGTPLYMSPEQARGQETDHRADIWALGVLLYECLTGEVPFRANNYLGVIAQVLNHKPPLPSELRPELGIPPAVESVLMRAMTKDIEARYQQMSELEHDLERLLAGDQNVGLRPRQPAGEPQRKRSPWGVVIAATVLLAGGLGLGMARRRPAQQAPAPQPVVSAPPAPPAPPQPVVTAPAAEQPSSTPAAHAPETRRASRRVRPAPAATPAATAAEPRPAISDSVRRGVLPVGSREAYSGP